ncbi:hypothetical protein H0H81_009115 [Sphagnurus paluster]|uniref:Translation initiation factor 2 gamma subunit n=1 Tax=Sphagnurus paluster TaxID=117069 RepID=A0A9P7KIV4_9AGAR|nr:hypothetical protein H0H81_009115 [Sphagnurus paluster]
MAAEENLQKREEESESEEEEDDVIETAIPKVEIDPSKLTPLSPEVISKQATINLGTIGHVAHGKSTVVKAISGVMTVRFKNELVRNITIKLGSINAKAKLALDQGAIDRTLRPKKITHLANARDVDTV